MSMLEITFLSQLVDFNKIFNFLKTHGRGDGLGGQFPFNPITFYLSQN